MAEVYDCSDSAQMLTGFRAARVALGRGELVVLPTDTVYGVGADAFNPAAVARLIAAKQRTRQNPPPVLFGSLATLHALAASVTEPILKLADQFWPGPLTMVVFAQPSLTWDLGDTHGTVALRMPAHDFTLQLLAETGPLAVSSANLHGEAPGLTAEMAQQQLGERVAVYLEAGQIAGDGIASTIIDVTELQEIGGVAASQNATVRVLRRGAVSAEELAAALPDEIRVVL